MVQTTDDVLEELEGIVGCKANLDLEQKDLFSSKTESLDNELDELLNYIGYDCTSIDDVVLQTDHTADFVCSMLMQLELGGYVVSVPGGYVRTRIPQKCDQGL